LKTPRFGAGFSFLREPNVKAIQNKLDFIIELEKLKAVLRKTRPIGLARRENSAEHSWQATLTALVFLDGTDLDPLKVLKMLLIHDVVEIDTGDVFVYDSEARHDVAAAERGAAERIFGLLPAPLNAELLALWVEFEEAQTAEAQFAKAIDRLNPVLQNLEHQDSSWNEFQITRNHVLAVNSAIEHISPQLWTMLKQRINKMPFNAETKG